MILRWRPSPSQLHRFVDGLVAQPLTYDQVGATIEGPLPPGFHHQRREAQLGADDRAFDDAADGLRRWQAHRGAGFDVVPADAPLAMGTDVAVVMGIGPVRALVPCRVVQAVDDADRFGFAYGTLPGHPESGEEAFVVSRRDDGTVVFEVSTFSRPANLITKLAGPLATKVQSLSLDRYVRALQQHVRT